MASDAFLGTAGLTVLLPLAALKPLVTALCLGSGASGGLFTPTLSTGAVLGGAAGIAWSLAWPGSPTGAYAIVGAAPMLGAAMQAPLTDLALMLELTSGGFGIMIPMITVLLTVYSHCIHGQDDLLNQQIDYVLEPSAGRRPCPSVESQRLHRPRDGARPPLSAMRPWISLPARRRPAEPADAKRGQQPGR